MSTALNNDRLRAIPHFAALDDGCLDSLRGGLRAVRFAAGDSLIVQGAPPDGAYFLDSGAADVVTKIPGGGEHVITAVALGAMVGDAALVDAGLRTASVRATARGGAVFLERAYFLGLLSQRHPAAMGVMRATIEALCQRLHDLNARVLAMDGPCLPGDIERQGKVRGGRAPFDVRAYLPVLPCCNRWDAENLDTFRRATRVRRAGPGAALFDAGDPGKSCFVVVRGAVSALARDGRGLRPLAALGPGRMVGVTALILGGDHGSLCVARGETVVLELPRAAFRRIYEGDTSLSLGLLNAIAAEFLRSLARTTSEYTRLSGHRLIRDAAGNLPVTVAMAPGA